MPIPLGSFLILGWYDHLVMFSVWEVRLYFWDISFWNISHALQFRASVLFVIVLLIPELPMHTVPSFTDDLFRMLANIKLDYFQDKPWSNRANYFLCFHWEASRLKAIFPAHLPSSSRCGLWQLCPHSRPTCAAGGRANSFISERVFELVFIRGTMKTFPISQNLHFKYGAGAGVKILA